jgi:hypothetical protein
LDKKNVYVTLETVGQDIMILRNLMHEISKHADCLSHPTLVNISQLIDQKLNERHHLISSD